MSQSVQINEARLAIVESHTTDLADLVQNPASPHNLRSTFSVGRHLTVNEKKNMEISRHELGVFKEFIGSTS